MFPSGLVPPQCRFNRMLGYNRPHPRLGTSSRHTRVAESSPILWAFPQRDRYLIGPDRLRGSRWCPSQVPGCRVRGHGERRSALLAPVRILSLLFLLLSLLSFLLIKIGFSFLFIGAISYCPSSPVRFAL